MLWPTSIASQRQTPRGEVAMTCAGEPVVLTSSDDNHDLGRWRS
jgi:hypothetical protein